ncbi:YIP1 family protein, partial [Candidatus Micrarchaeota archaeon]|nr:YIP1 family protein [Candidatus Micrarchaeota archaeon]
MDIMGKFSESVKLVNPSTYVSTIESYKGKGDFGEAVKIVAVALLVVAVLSYIYTLVGASIAAMLPSDAVVDVGGIPGVGAGVAAGGAIMIVLTFVFGIIGFVVAQYVYLYIAKALGGTGKLGPQANLMAMLQLFVGPVVAVFAFIPCLGGLVAFVLGLWALYLSYKILKVVHNLDLVKTIITLVVGWIVTAVVIGVPAALIGT